MSHTGYASSFFIKNPGLNCFGGNKRSFHPWPNQRECGERRADRIVPVILNIKRLNLCFPIIQFMHKYMHSMKFLLLLVFFIQAEYNASAQNVSFSKDRADWYFGRCSAKEKLIFLSNLLASEMKKSSEIGPWLNQKIESWTTMLDEVSEEDVDYILFHKFSNNSVQFDNQLPNRIVNKWGETHPYKQILASAVYFLILHEIDYGNVKNTLPYFKMLQRVIVFNPDRKFKMWYYRLFGSLLRKYGMTMKSIEAYQLALSFTSEKRGLDRLFIYNDLAYCYMSVENYPRAKHYILKSLSKHNSSRIPFEALNMLGAIYGGLGDSNEELKVRFFLLNYALKEHDYVLAFASYSNIANTHFEMKEYKKALHYLNKSDEICEKQGIQIGHDFNKISRAYVFLEQKKYYEAYVELQNIEAIVKSYEDADILKNFYNIMYQTQLELGQIDLAKSYFQEYLIYQAKTSGKELNIMLGEQEIENQKNANQAVLAALEQERLKDFYMKIFLSLALFALLALVLLTVVYGAKKREKTRLEGIIEKNDLVKALEAKSKELLAESIKNLSIDAVKENIKTDLELLVDELPERQKDLFKPFLKQLSKNERNQYIEEFETRFLGVYESFYEKLRELIPDLSPAEAKFCAFIKLNFSTKEISFITNRSPRTIDNTRSRIRKKLGLETDVNLHTFLAEL